MITVYLIYLKTRKDLYAFTINKELRDDFLRQRNRECFYVKKEKMDELEFGVFATLNMRKALSNIPLTTDVKDENVTIVATIDEDSGMMSMCDDIDNEVGELKKRMSEHQLKDKYMESIEYLTRISYFKRCEYGALDHLSTINLLAVFHTKFRNTFFPKPREIPDE